MPVPFHADAMHVLYEADPGCIGAVEETVSASRLRTLALPHALGARPEAGRIGARFALRHAHLIEPNSGGAHDVGA